MSTTQENQTVRNGFPVVTRESLLHDLEEVRFDLEPLRPILKAIKRLSTDDKEIAGLMRLAEYHLEVALGDIDVLRECAEKAGTAGELVEEGCDGEGWR